MRFILVDRIVSLTPGAEIAAVRLIRDDEDYFADHFPGFPVVPGVLLTEMMAQTAGKCLDAERRPRGKAMLAKILSASFRQWVRPGDEVQLHARITANDERYATAECTAQVNGATAAQAKLFITFLAPGQLAADFRDPVLEDFFGEHPRMSDLFGLQGMCVLVTGGTRGIGRAISLRLARAGAAVVANYARNDETAEALKAQALTEGLALDVLRADLTMPKGLASVKERMESVQGQTLSIVHCAATGVHRPFDQLTLRQWDWTMALNVRAFFELVQTLLPLLREGSAVVPVSSAGAVRAVPAYTTVGSSKAALESLARHMASELAPRGIRVNILSPGSVETDAWDAFPDKEQRLAEAIQRSPLGRLVTLDEVAHAAQFLCSPASRGMVGHTLVIDGGTRNLE